MTAEAPEQRYDSVGALQRDLRRLLAHVPVAALTRRGAYVLRKLLRRHWPWALVGVGALVLGAGFTARLVQERDRALAAEQLAQTIRELAEQEGQRAPMEADTTRETSRFLMTLFTGADPKLMGAPDLPKSVLLVKGRERIRQEMDKDAGTRARLQLLLGDVYERIGRPADAVAAYADSEAESFSGVTEQRAKTCPI